MENLRHCSDSRIRRVPTVAFFSLIYPLATRSLASYSFPAIAKLRSVPSRKKSEYERRTGLELRKKKWNSCVRKRNAPGLCSLGTESTTHLRCKRPPLASPLATRTTSPARLRTQSCLIDRLEK